MLKLTDIRKTTRRSGKDGLRVIYPRFLRDVSLAPRIEMAIRYMDRMLGQPRRALDDEVMVQLFGDHKVARCLVACLGAHYRHRPRAFAEVLPPEAVSALAERGITTASQLRLWLFRRVNRAMPGFVGRQERTAFLAEIERELGLAAGQLDTLIALDAPEQAILVRSGQRPSPEDIIARYNFALTVAVLSQSSVVRVNLARALSAAEAAAARSLAARLDVPIDLAGHELALSGRQDALASWTRHGGKLARLLAMLVSCGLPARNGEALVASPQGEQWIFRLDGETFGYLGATSAPHLDLAAFCAHLEVADRLLVDAAVLRRAGSLDGWVLRRASEPLVARGQLAWALCWCVRGDERVALLPLLAGDASAHLRPLAEAIPLIAVRSDELADGETDTAMLDVLRYVTRNDLLALPATLEQVITATVRQMGVVQVEAVCEEASAVGVLTELALARRLGCAEEEIVGRLTEPAARSACQRRSLEYIEGFGLCTRAMLAQVRRAASDMREMRDNPQVGSAWMMRTLGRRLREVTGTHEGIECLIAWLGAA